MDGSSDGLDGFRFRPHISSSEVRDIVLGIPSPPRREDKDIKISLLPKTQKYNLILQL
jgi:hypothetical protein